MLGNIMNRPLLATFGDYPMKNTILVVIASFAVASPALADCGLRDENGTRAVYSSLGKDAQVYGGGCDAFARFDLNSSQIKQLLASGNCSVEANSHEEQIDGDHVYGGGERYSYLPFNGCRIEG